jgi:uncharacterized membrane protein (UPF0127 family)
MVKAKSSSSRNIMILKNISKKLIISEKAKIANSFFDRLFGLLNPNNPRYLVFRTHFGIHTFFMMMPIDVLLLDDDQKVIKFHKNLVPNRLFLYHPKYSTVIEMPKDTIEKYHIDINDKISFG